MLGCYWLTNDREGARGEGKIFSSTEEVRIAYDSGEVEEQAKISVRIKDELVQSTVGRVLLSEILPANMPFFHVNQLMTKKEIAKLVDRVYRLVGLHDVVVMLDRLKDLGFSYATKAGVSICIDNMHIPSRKTELIDRAQGDVSQVQNQYSEGLITNGERYNKVIDIWAHVSEQVAIEMMKEISQGGGAR